MPPPPNKPPARPAAKPVARPAAPVAAPPPRQAPRAPARAAPPAAPPPPPQPARARTQNVAPTQLLDAREAARALELDDDDGEVPTSLAGPEVVSAVRAALDVAENDATIMGMPDVVAQIRAQLLAEGKDPDADGDGSAFEPESGQRQKPDASLLQDDDDDPLMEPEDGPGTELVPAPVPPPRPTAQKRAAPLPPAPPQRTPSRPAAPVQADGPDVLHPAAVKPPVRTHRVGDDDGKLLLAVPDGARVEVAGTPAGTGSVLLVGLSPQGKMAVEVSHPGYATWRSMVSLGGRNTGQVKVELRRG